MVGDLVVRSGQTYVVDKPYNQAFENLVMEDNSVIQVINSVDFILSASKATFGNNTLINGSGSSGSNGANSTHIPPQSGYNDHGYDGEAGGNGLPGHRGSNITIQVGLISIGSLKIYSNGGAGGFGGNGGEGGRGGDATCTGGAGATGGWGGPSGIPGRGGDAGQIIFRWIPLKHIESNLVPLSFDEYISDHRESRLILKLEGAHNLVLAAPTNLAWQSSGGLTGKPGIPGQGGWGGNDKDCGFWSPGGGAKGHNGIIPPFDSRNGLDKQANFILG